MKPACAAREGRVLSVSLRSTAPPKGEPRGNLFSLAGARQPPGRGSRGETSSVSQALDSSPEGGAEGKPLQSRWRSTASPKGKPGRYGIMVCLSLRERCHGESRDGEGRVPGRVGPSQSRYARQLPRRGSQGETSSVSQALDSSPEGGAEGKPLQSRWRSTAPPEGKPGRCGIMACLFIVPSLYPAKAAEASDSLHPPVSRPRCARRVPPAGRSSPQPKRLRDAPSAAL